MTEGLPFEPGAHLAGHVILRPIGQGRYGRVFEAHFNRQPRALKIMDVGHDVPSQTIARIHEECETRAAIDHVNVAQFFGAGTVGTIVWISMEYISGVTCREYLVGACGRPPLHDFVRAMAQACDGLAEVHRHGITHRDVKPENIMITPSGDVKIVDFGFAKPEHSDVKTTLGKIVGTPVYLAPEAFAGEPLHPKRDVYAIGIILYEGLAGSHPMGSLDQTLAALVERHRRGRLPPLRDVALHVPGDLAALVDRAVDPNPSHRVTMKELAEGLHTALNRLRVEHRKEAANLPLPHPRGPAKLPTESMPQVETRLQPSDAARDNARFASRPVWPAAVPLRGSSPLQEPRPAPHPLAATADMAERIPAARPRSPLAATVNMPDLLPVSASNPPVSGSVAPPRPSRRRTGAAALALVVAILTVGSVWFWGRSVRGPAASGAGERPPASTEPFALPPPEAGAVFDAGALPDPVTPASGSSPPAPTPTSPPSRRPKALWPKAPMLTSPAPPRPASHRVFGADR